MAKRFKKQKTVVSELWARITLWAESSNPEVICSVPVDEVFIVVTLHLVLDGCLQVTDPFEGQLKVRLQALIRSL